MSHLIYGLVVDGVLTSNRLARPVAAADGVYQLDMNEDDFMATLAPADFLAAVRYFRQASRIAVTRGVTYGAGYIPDRVIGWQILPVPVRGLPCENWEYIETAQVRDGPVLFLQTVTGPESYALAELRECYEQEQDGTKIKHTTPAMRVCFALQVVARQHKAAQEPVQVITTRLALAGATGIKVRPIRQGFVVDWTLAGHQINTLLGPTYQVLEAGFCVSGYDHSQHVTSLPHLLQAYVDDGSYIHKTRGR